jgi:MFS family permease
MLLCLPWKMLISFKKRSSNHLFLGLIVLVLAAFQVLFLSRVVIGLVKHSSNGVKAYISDRVSKSERSIDFGRMATASGLGFMVGPIVGGYLYR